MNMNDFDYFKASRLELLEHLVAELTDISTDPECKARTDFSNYQVEWECGTYYCGAGWMGYRSHVPPIGVHPYSKDKILHPIFESIFAWRDEDEELSIMQGLLGIDWELIFGEFDTGGYDSRIHAAKQLLLKEQLSDEGEV